MKAVKKHMELTTNAPEKRESKPAAAPPTATPDTINHALRLAAEGFKVFPLAPGKKEPALAVSWPTIATKNPTKIRGMWTVKGVVKPFNIGVALDADTLVIDVDVKKGQRGAESLKFLEILYDALPPTYAVGTASGGEHLYFRVNPKDGPFGKTLAPEIENVKNIDVKTVRSYVVGPGSVIDGKLYTARGNPRALAVLPETYVALAKPKNRSAGAGQTSSLIKTDDDEVSIYNATNYLLKEKPAVEGDHGDDWTIVVANRAMDLVTPANAFMLMDEFWNPRCSPPWSARELKAKVDSAAKSRRTPIKSRDPENEFGPVDVVSQTPARIESTEPVDLWAEKEIQAPIDIPPNCVPSFIQRFAENRSLGLGCNIGPVALSTLVSLSCLIPAGNVVQMRQKNTGWPLRPTLWGAIVGESGTGKSPAVKTGIKLARAVEEAWWKEHATTVELQDLAQPQNPKQNRPRRSKDSPSSKQNETTPTASDKAPPIAPRPRQKITTDATIEAMMSVLANNPAGMMYFAEELASFFGGMDAYKVRAGKDRPWWIGTKDGDPDAINRKNSVLHVPVRSVSVLGTIQPEPLRKFAQDTADGLVQRFQFAPIWRINRGVDLPEDDELNALASRVATTLAAASQKGQFRLSPDAAKELDSLHTFVDQELGRPEHPDFFRNWIDKMPNEFGRLCLAFHFIEWASLPPTAKRGDAPPEHISQGTARLAKCFLIEFQFQNARWVFASESPHAKAALSLAGFIITKGLDKITTRTAQSSCHALRRNAASIVSVMRFLESAGWLVPVPGNQTTWSVNAAVFDGRFETYRLAESERRATQRAGIIHDGAERRAMQAA